MTRLVVKTHSPWRVRIMALGLLTAAGLSGWGLHRLGYHRAGLEFQALQVERSRLAELNAELTRTNTELRERRAILERSSQVEHVAYKQLEGTVGGLQDEILELKEELAFYRGIVSPGDTGRGLTIQSLQITRRAVERGFHYKLVLTQVLDNATVARGEVSMNIEGIQNGVPRELSLQEAGSVKSDLAFRFKYFQNLEGDLLLPEGFIPARVTVFIDAQGRKQKRLEKVFDWPVEES